MPIRAIFEAMGYTVTWGGSKQTATAVNGNDKITVQIGNSAISYTVGGKSGTYLCDTPPQVSSERILVPVQAFVESAGCSVNRDESISSVIIVK